MTTYQSKYPSGYYVYAYIRSKDSENGKSGTPYYIGKGKRERAWSTNHRVRLPTDKKNIIILQEKLDEYQAHDLEIRLIRWYGRLDLNTGILQNRTDGGDGVRNQSAETKALRAQNWVGRKHSLESRDKMSKSKKGVPSSRKGIPGPIPSQQTRNKMSESHTGLTRTEETKQKMRDAQLGKTHTIESKQKISNANKGRVAHNKGKPSYVLGRKWWNNGSKNIMSISCPGDGWVLGRYQYKSDLPPFSS